MNLLFESQNAKPPVTRLVFPDMVEMERSAAALAEGDAARGSAAASMESAALLDKLAIEAQLEAAREQGREEVFAESVRRLREGLEIERTAVTHLCTSFRKERERYFAEVEGEIVKLSLAIAARILQRESSMDPTLLAGVVRVALSKLSDPAGAVLRMNEDDEEAWRGAMRNCGLQVASDPMLEQGELRLEAAGGVAELGVKAQLVEIERGFFDLLARRPA